MGNSASKATRSFPKRSPAPWAGARTPAPSEAASAGPSSQAGAVREGVAKASEQRTPDIEQDAGDPDFLRALNKLGPVRVDHGAGMQAAQTQSNQVKEINRLFQSRAASEDEASSLKPSPNHLYAASLHELLDARKSARSKAELESLAKRYNVDYDKMERLAKFVNSPSVDERLTVKNVDKNGDERVTLTAVWAQPRIQPS
ncbi:hypothetical protein EST38_g1642 [Candolleomyces aberdarensis]|uniref:Uncharacterized protein n=1 Tax=Candolleomyces aberdarensis TaxID=2316362 RepID=A0A4Q2DUV2_9AGAR|nr:hypothetical protein EST38_g1642 [Candolleomyces aberdarensis]